MNRPIFFTATLTTILKKQIEGEIRGFMEKSRMSMFLERYAMLSIVYLHGER
jgi:hypothetical protein